MKASEMRDMAIDELEAAVSDVDKELFNILNEAKRTRKVEKPHLLQLNRKKKARLLTVIHEKQSVSPK